MNTLNEQQQKAYDMAKSDVREHWAKLMDTTPERIQTILDDEHLGLHFRPLFQATVLEVINQVYPK